MKYCQKNPSGKIRRFAWARGQTGDCTATLDVCGKPKDKKVSAQAEKIAKEFNSHHPNLPEEYGSTGL